MFTRMLEQTGFFLSVINIKIFLKNDFLDNINLNKFKSFSKKFKLKSTSKVGYNNYNNNNLFLSTN